MDYQENFKIHKKEKNIDVEGFDVEELVQINQKILLMHKLGIIDFLIAPELSCMTKSENSSIIIKR